MQDWITSFENAKLKATQESNAHGPIQQASKITIDDQIDVEELSEGDDAFELKSDWRSSVDLKATNSNAWVYQDLIRTLTVDSEEKFEYTSKSLKRQNQQLHGLFKSVPESDYLLDGMHTSPRL